MIKNNLEIDVKVKCLEEGVTQAQLAQMVGTSAPYVSRLINKRASSIRFLSRCSISWAMISSLSM